jgi:hypothetical protein
MFFSGWAKFETKLRSFLKFVKANYLELQVYNGCASILVEVADEFLVFQQQI